MAEKYPPSYPEAENYHFPKTEVEVLDEELRHATSPEDFRLSIVGLSRQYGDTPLLLGMRKYARLSNISKAVATGESSPINRGMDIDFYAGEVMAVHSVIKTQDTTTRQRAWRRDFLSAYSPDSSITEEESQALERAIGGLIQHREDIYEELEELPEDVQESLINVAGTMYHPHEQTRQDDFVAGYVYARGLLHFAIAEGVI